MRQETEKREYTQTDRKHREIPCCSWMPASPKSQIVLVHGFSEHYRYYGAFAQKIGKNGIAVHAMDLPGHGAAGGARGHIENFQDYIDNVDLLFASNPNFRKVPTYLFGHSLGGLIASHYCMQKGPRIEGLILTSPLFGFPPSNLPVKYLAKILVKRYADSLFPKPCSTRLLSRDIGKRDMYRNDPYRVLCISPTLLLSMYEYSETIRKRAGELQTSLLLFASQKDRIVSPDAIRRFVATYGAEDKTLVVFSQAMHELIQEEESTQVLQKTISWIAEHS